jgi:hypothetical protein
MHTEFYWETIKEKDRMEDLRADGRIILERILTKLDDRVWIGIMWLRKGKK